MFGTRPTRTRDSDMGIGLRADGSRAPVGPIRRASGPVTTRNSAPLQSLLRLQCLRLLVSHAPQAVLSPASAVAVLLWPLSGCAFWFAVAEPEPEIFLVRLYLWHICPQVRNSQFMNSSCLSSKEIGTASVTKRTAAAVTALHGAQRASDLQFYSTGVTAGTGIPTIFAATDQVTRSPAVRASARPAGEVLRPVGGSALRPSNTSSKWTMIPPGVLNWNHSNHA